LSPKIKIASYGAEPVALVEDSESADVTADLVDVGRGGQDSDYAGKDVKGKIILTSGQPGALEDLAVGNLPPQASSATQRTRRPPGRAKMTI
jgi:hypothetical protein